MAFTSSCNKATQVRIVLQELTYKKLPKLYKHLQTTQCEMSIIATDWFLCLFATTLPSEVMSPLFCHFLSRRAAMSSALLLHQQCIAVLVPIMLYCMPAEPEWQHLVLLGSRWHNAFKAAN